MNKLVETYCDVDDFSKLFFPSWQRILLENGEIKRRRACRLSPSEVMTIIIHFHQSHYRDFKNYYLHYVCRQLKAYFPELLSYTRFLALMPSVVVPMCSYLTSKLGKPTGIQFVDSTKIEVCHIIRAKRNKVFEGVAHHGKGTMGWSYGFKLHLIINHLGEIVALKLTTVRKNMKKKFISLWDRALLKKRFIIETVNDQLKNISYIEHSRHRSMHGFMLNLLGGLIAYCLKEEKPSLDLTSQELEILESNNLMLA